MGLVREDVLLHETITTMLHRVFDVLIVIVGFLPNAAPRAGVKTTATRPCDITQSRASLQDQNILGETVSLL